MSTTTEETNAIAAAVQCGKADVLLLWEAVRRFVWQQARRRIQALDGRRGVEVEDLAQVGFIAMLDAVGSFDAAAGFAFMTWFGVKLKAAFQEATGCRTKRQWQEPLDNSISLETPLSDDDDAGVLGDTIPDPAAEAAFSEVEERDRLQRLHDALEAALETLPKEQADALRNRFYLDREADTLACNSAMRALRHPRISQNLRSFYDSFD